MIQQLQLSGIWHLSQLTILETTIGERNKTITWRISLSIK